MLSVTGYINKTDVKTTFGHANTSHMINQFVKDSSQKTSIHCSLLQTSKEKIF